MFDLGELVEEYRNVDRGHQFPTSAVVFQHTVGVVKNRFHNLLLVIYIITNDKRGVKPLPLWLNQIYFFAAEAGATFLASG